MCLSVEMLDDIVVVDVDVDAAHRCIPCGVEGKCTMAGVEGKLGLVDQIPVLGRCGWWASLGVGDDIPCSPPYGFLPVQLNSVMYSCRCRLQSL